MSNSPRRRIVLFVIGVMLGLLALLLFRCKRQVAQPPPPPTTPLATQVTPPVAPQNPTPAPAPVTEQLTAATVEAPTPVKAGARFIVQWTGPNNPEDFVTIVRPDAAEGSYDHHRMTREGSPIELTAPMTAGEWEVRYVTGRSRKVLGRTPLTIAPVEAAITGPAEAVLGKDISVGWTGPNNEGDYVTVVKAGVPDGQYGNHTYTTKGSPLTLTMPADSGDAELRYMSGQGAKVLARSPIKITAPEIVLAAADDAIAGSTLNVEWTGPANRADYITIVAKTAPDGNYGNYSDVSKGSPLSILVPIEPGEAELRYVSGQGAKVLGRRPLRVTAAEVSLDSPAEASAGATVTINWKGPNYRGDYVTVVPKGTRDGLYGKYAETNKGSPLAVGVPKEPGPAEIRYMSGQGDQVLARRALSVVGPAAQ